MIFGVVLAGGIGSRMGNVEKPKQFLTIGDKPIIIHTLEKFYLNDKFEQIIVLCPTQWVEHTKNLIKKYLKDENRVVVIPGGETRNDTIMNAIAHIEKNFSVDDDTIIVTHDPEEALTLSDRVMILNGGGIAQYGKPSEIIKSPQNSFVSNFILNQLQIKRNNIYRLFSGEMQVV